MLSLNYAQVSPQGRTVRKSSKSPFGADSQDTCMLKALQSFTKSFQMQFVWQSYHHPAAKVSHANLTNYVTEVETDRKSRSHELSSRFRTPALVCFIPDWFF